MAISFVLVHKACRESLLAVAAPQLCKVFIPPHFFPRMCVFYLLMFWRLKIIFSQKNALWLFNSCFDVVPPLRLCLKQLTELVYLLNILSIQTNAACKVEGQDEYHPPQGISSKFRNRFFLVTYISSNRCPFIQYGFEIGQKEDRRGEISDKRNKTIKELFCTFV